MDRTVVVGVGNTYVTDDGVGVHVVRELEKVKSDARIVCKELATGGLDILPCLNGFDNAIIVDAAKTGRFPVGHLFRISPSESPPISKPVSLHTIGLTTAIRLGLILDLRMPREITILAVEVYDTETFHEGCTAEVRIAIPRVVSQIIHLIKSQMPDLQFLSHRHKEVMAL